MVRMFSLAARKTVGLSPSSASSGLTQDTPGSEDTQESTREGQVTDDGVLRMMKTQGKHDTQL